MLYKFIVSFSYVIVNISNFIFIKNYHTICLDSLLKKYMRKMDFHSSKLTSQFFLIYREGREINQMITKKIRIQFVDTDMSQRIHYSAIFRYFEIMDHDFFRRIGYSYKKIFQLGLDMPR